MFRFREASAVALLVGASLLVTVAAVKVAHAGGSSLPPDVDLDPERGMTFGRIRKTRLPSDVLAPFKQTLRPHVMDSSIDPFTPMVGSGRYDPATGKIQGGVSETAKRMRSRQKSSRSSRSSRSSGISRSSRSGDR